MASTNIVVKRRRPQLRYWNDLRFWISCQTGTPWMSTPIRLYDQWRYRRTDRDPLRREITSKTRLVIEGFPSSANSFLVRNLEQVLDGQAFHYADHQHSPAIIAKAVGLGIPVILCVREPLDVAVSASRRWPLWSVADQMERYIKFHNALIPYLGEAVVSDFSLTIQDPMKVLEVANERFSLGLALVRAAVDATEAERPGKSREEIDGAKTVEREGKALLREEFLTGGHEVLYAKARNVYRTVLAGGGVVQGGPR